MADLSKQKVLADVGTLVQKGELTFQELQNVYNYNIEDPSKVSTEKAPKQKVTADAETQQQHAPLTIANVLYIVGTLIVCLGIFTLISQNWEEMNTMGRIWSTLGIGLAVFAGGFYRVHKEAGRDTNKDLLTSSLFTIASVATTIGIAVALYELGVDFEALGTDTCIALVLSAGFVALYRFVRRSLVFLTVGITMAVVAFYLAVGWLTKDIAGITLLPYFETAVAGTWLVLGGLFLRTRTIASGISGLLTGIGTFMALGSLWLVTLASGLDGDNDMRYLYDLLYPLALAAGVGLSVYAKSRGILVLTAIFLTGYIFEISSEYFSGFLGGALALCLAGVAVMGMAYGATRFAKRFIAGNQ